MQIIKQFFLIIIFSLCSSVFGQTNYQTKDSTYIFWQDGIRINYNDYKGAPFPNYIPVIAQLGIWTVLDLSEKAVTKSKDEMRFYIAPLFDRFTSVADSNDSLLIAVNNIYFDICELCAREARIKFSSLSDSIKISDTLSSVFKLTVKEMHEKRLKMNRKFYRDFFIEKKKDAILMWRNKINDDLQKTTEWVTKPEECYRFILGKPLELGYFEDLKSNPIVILDNYEQTLAPCGWHAGFYQISRQRLEENKKNN